MATMLSSPMGPSLNTGKYDLFDQPSSPTYKHDDLPAEFGDQSFGSSMSLGSSFELHRMTASGSSSSQLSIFAAQNRAQDDYAGATIRMPAKRSPPRTGQESLGAAMGTVLNSKSPGLAAKMNSLDYMDMSSPPSRQNNATPPKACNDENDYLPPGSAMKEDTPVQRVNTSRRSTSETTNTTGNSLGRLFGTELSINSRHHSFQSGVANKSFACQPSPDKEPPLKRRPSSLPLQEIPASARSSLRSGGMGPPASSSAASR
jgi:M-phase inducer tyrosine phosphatase